MLQETTKLEGSPEPLSPPAPPRRKNPRWLRQVGLLIVLGALGWWAGAWLVGGSWGGWGAMGAIWLGCLLNWLIGCHS